MGAYAEADLPYRRLLRQSVGALLVCAVLVTVCYFFVDRPVAFKLLAPGHRLEGRLHELRWPQHPGVVRLYAVKASLLGEEQWKEGGDEPDDVP